MAEKIATRNAYGQALADLSDRYENLVVLDADLSNATMTKFFAAKCPDRFFNCGIAEGNMTGIAAGMAASGLQPFTNTFAVFACGRAFEQIRNSIAYPRLNVKIVGSHGGVSVGEDGATHQCVEDFSLMRTLPNMLVCCPCDGNEMRLAVEALLNYDGPAYLRLERPATPIVTDSIPDYHFELGKGCKLREGTDVTIIAVGILVPMALEAADTLSGMGISAKVIDMHTIKPIDKEIILEAAKDTGCIVTCEEHSIIGGLGSAVSEVVASSYVVPVVRLGINDEFGRSGSASDALKYFRLCPEEIVSKAQEAISMKKLG